MARTRSKNAKKIKEETHSDETYQTNLYLYDDAKQLVRDEMEYRGRLKREDWVTVQKYHNQHGVLLSREQRQVPLLAKGLSYREARSIIEVNDDLYDSALQTNELNIKNWTKRLKKADHNERRRLQARIDKAQHLSVCLGSKTLFRQAQKDPVAMQRWREKRLFLQMGGEVGFAQGNSCIRLHHNETHDDGSISYIISLKRIGTRKFVPIGVARFKKGGDYILAALNSNSCVSAQILVKNGVYKLHVTPRVPASYIFEDKTSNVASPDFNHKHAEITVIDPKANIVAQASFPWDKGSDMPTLAEQLMQFAIKHGAKRFGIEKLSGLQANRANKQTGNKSGKTRHIANQLPTKQFEQACTRAARRHNIYLSYVDPYDTSRATVQWSEKRFGVNVHFKASYLIARRTMGYSIYRKTVRNNSGSVQRITTPAQTVNPPTTNHDQTSKAHQTRDKATVTH